MSAKVDVKCVLLGAAAAGKTTLVERYLNKRFTERNHCNTRMYFSARADARKLLQAFNAKKISINNETLTLGLWDTAGSERYKSMSRIYYKGAQFALVCFDVRSNDSFENVKFWIAELKESEPTCLAFIVACKCDLKDSDSVDETVVRNYASSVDAQLFETSSKTGRGVDELFFAVAEAHLRNPNKLRNA